MKALCDNLRAYLTGELSLVGEIRMRIHMRSCAGCRADAAVFRRLMSEQEQMEDVPLPDGLTDRVMADAIDAASTRAQCMLSMEPHAAGGVPVMKRAVLAGAMLVVMLTIGIGLFSRGGSSTALADVMRAMTQAKSMHLVGWTLDDSGKKSRVEVWAKGDSKVKMVYGDDWSAVDDGEKLVSMINFGGKLSATIKQTREFPGLQPGMSYPNLFMGDEVLKSLMRTNSLGNTDVRSATLPDGRPIKVIELQSGPAKATWTVDARSDLLLKQEVYDDQGRLRLQIGKVEYDKDIADSVFAADIPKDASVTDLRVPLKEDREQWRQDMEKKLRGAGGVQCAKFDRGEGGTQYHSGLRFRALGPMNVFYLRDRNAYYVLGKAYVYDKKVGFAQTVEDAEFPAPYKSDESAHQPRAGAETECKPTAEDRQPQMLIQKLQSQGAKPVLSGVSGEGWSCGCYHAGMSFHGISQERTDIVFWPQTNEYQVIGKARVSYLLARDRIVENGRVPAMGRPTYK